MNAPDPTLDARPADGGPDMDMIEPDQEHTVYRIERWIASFEKTYAETDAWAWTGELSADKDRAITLRDEMAAASPQHTYRVVSETTTVTHAVVR